MQKTHREAGKRILPDYCIYYFPVFRCTGSSVTSVSSGIISSALDSSLTISRKTRISTVRTVWGSMEAPKDCRERNQRIRRGVRVEVTWTQTEGWNKITQAAAQPLGINNITSRIRSTLAEDKENYLNISLKCCAIISCFLWKHWDCL